MKKYEITKIEIIINNQIIKFLKNCFDFKLDFKKLGNTKINTAIKNKAGIISSSTIVNFSKNF